MTTYRLDRDQIKDAETLISEARPFATGETRVWARRYTQKVTYGEPYDKLLASTVPVHQSKVHIDTRIFHDIPTELGVVYAVQNSTGTEATGKSLLPTEFFITLRGNLPRPAYIRRGRSRSEWITLGYEENIEGDDFKTVLDGIKGRVDWKECNIADYGQQFTFSHGKVTFDFPYTMQLIQMPSDRFVFAYFRRYQAGQTSRRQAVYFVKEFLDLASSVQSAIENCDLQGVAVDESVVAVPTLSMLAIPEMKGHVSDHGIEIEM